METRQVKKERETMGKTKNHLVLSVISFLLVLTLLGSGTFAWFMDTEHVGANFQSGVLDIKLSVGQEGKAVPLHFTNLRPLTIEQLQDEFQMDENGVITNKNLEGYVGAPLYFYQLNLENQGTLPMQLHLAIREQEKGNNPDLPYGDEVPNILDNGNGGVEIDDQEPKVACQNDLRSVLQIQLYQTEKTVDGFQLKPVAEAAPDNNTVTLWKDGIPSDYAIPDVLPAGETASYIVAAWLPDTVGNDSQGKHFHGALYVNAGQVDTGASMAPLPDWSSSITPDEGAVAATVKVRYMWKLNDGSTVGPILDNNGSAEFRRSIAEKPGELALLPSTDELAGYHLAEGEKAYRVTLAEDGTIAYQGEDTAATFVMEQDPYIDDETREFDSGSGTEQDPYVIMNARQLDNLNQYCGFESAQSGQYFVLGRDIDLSGYYNPEWAETGWQQENGWMPLGRVSNVGTRPFYFNHFDGKNRTIAGLNISCSSSQSLSIGLFNACAGGYVKNLDVLGAHIAVNSTDSRVSMGIIASSIYGGTRIENCHVRGGTLALTGSGQSCCGLIGSVQIPATLKDCTVDVAISAPDSEKTGLLMVPYNAQELPTILNCTGTGTINGEAVSYDSNVS